MIKTNPETLNEIKAVKNVLTIAKYYNVSQEFLDEAYDYIMANKEHKIQGQITQIKFMNGNTTEKIFSVDRPSMSIDGLILTATFLSIIPHYTPSSG